ncbi:hypothetical protein LSH36_1g23005 [Paralvinella palmiformis]|uniref:Protein YIF1 n=1 Tax=Paralvinella palmiformis TaxID=53620 RepID=A0AAD9KG91_9ANNE|nr:hypothetical protein LSH36_1g23005 [Paralvinella palmiformis]
MMAHQLEPCTGNLQDWTIKYNQDEPVTPRYDINAPDLYIPGGCYVHVCCYGICHIHTVGWCCVRKPEQVGIISKLN